MDRTTKKRKSKQHNIPIPEVPKKRSSPTFLDQEARQKLEAINEQRIVFSFRFFDRFSEEAFNCGGTKDGWFIALIDQLKSFSNLKLKDFKSDPRRREQSRIHPLNWEELKYKFDLDDDLFEQIESDCWQFAISKGNGRVHGFLIHNTFFVVWLDPHHNLYPMKRHGGTKLFPPPMTPYEELKKENEELRKELDELYKYLEEKTEPG